MGWDSQLAEAWALDPSCGQRGLIEASGATSLPRGGSRLHPQSSNILETQAVYQRPPHTARGRDMIPSQSS